MDPHNIFIATAALFAVGVYAQRINRMTWRTHLARCVVAQVSGAVLSCALIYAAAGGVSPGWMYPALLLLLLHLSVTSERWASGPPPETESRPMPLDGAPQ